VDGRDDGEVGGRGELAGVGSEIGIWASDGDACRRLGVSGLDVLKWSGSTSTGATEDGGKSRASLALSGLTCPALDLVRLATDRAEGKLATTSLFDPFDLKAVPHLLHFPFRTFF